MTTERQANLLPERDPSPVPASSAAFDDGLSHLFSRRQTTVTVQQLAWALRAARAWLGDEVNPSPQGMHRYQADMRLRVSDRPSIVTFGKAAYVDFGELRRTGDGWEVEIAWRAAALAPLFPVFAGTLVARPGEVSVSGWYAPPGGALGRAADRAVLHIAASGTARWLLAEVEKAARRAGGYASSREPLPAPGGRPGWGT